MDVGGFKNGKGGGGKGDKERCQICKKKGHSAKTCWYRDQSAKEGKGSGSKASSAGVGA